MSSYVHYEEDRSPPAEILLGVSRLTGIRLEWLISGEGPQEEAESRPGQPRESNSLVGADRAAWIPVIGSTAAGTARFWTEIPQSPAGPLADERLSGLVMEASRRGMQWAAGKWEGPLPVESESRTTLIQCAEPDETGLLEFIAAAALKRRFPGAVAWRIDGESMVPRYLDGDLVIVSPDAAAVDGQPCVARQSGQIGVNCKLFRREGNQALLIPINERFPIDRVPIERIEWAYRVIAVLRLGPPNLLP